ncbi:hypothetical protein RN001_004092 [Aquatica leii]|uniref:Uncharacterized protein n=1 Tax=Aquatica leii TaxID=1421715 RepID=A0AAN7SEH1_9COLE|nr:hypothetical protein RN001_004092 [Aquatica leii]
MFVLLEFREHNQDTTVGVVHSSWLTPKKKEVYWPAYKNQSAFDKAILKGEPVGNKWELFTVKRIFGTYDDYKEAQRKCLIAENTSDLQTEAEEENTNCFKIKRRRINRPLRYLDDDCDKNEDADRSSEDEQYGTSNLRRPPLVNQVTAKHRAAMIQNNELLGCYLPPINLSSASHAIPSSSRESTPISELRSTPVASRETSAVFREEIRKCKTAPWFNPSPGSSRGSTPGFEARPTITDTLEENSAVFLEEIGKCGYP